MLPEHGQLMQYDVQDTSTSSYTHGSATGMVRWQPLCRICTRLHATRVERAAEATSARVASAGMAQFGSSCGSQLVSYHGWAVLAAGAAEKAAGCSYYMLSAKVNVCVTSTARSDL